MALPLPLLAGVLLAATVSVSFAAASAATVEFPKEALPTSSSYLPVDPSGNASLFYAYYEASHPLTAPADTPLLLWLQGGPAARASSATSSSSAPTSSPPTPTRSPATP